AQTAALWGGNIANLTTEASLPSVRFVFEFIMAVLFASYFYNTVSCTLPKAPGLPGVAEAEGFKKI
ncbi:MAG: hypothetical protein ACLS3H_12090, partial [Hominisplanchenecus sp.]|uniref:hypothetical protein n=1 Tax=Hominisplanchenecus sp. TaxID=3038130 RepID=UPI003995011E